MGLKEWLIPQEKVFFTLFEKHSKMVVEASHRLKELFDKPNSTKEKRSEIKKLEHECDNVVHEIYDKLSEIFITPFDHEDISKLASNYDDVIDWIYAVSNLAFLFNIKKITPEMKKLAEIIVKQVEEVDSAFLHIKQMNKPEIDKRCVEIHRLENDADEVFNKGIEDLFRHNNPMKAIKIKEVYEFLEVVTDKCEDVALVIRDIIIKNR